LEQEAAVSDRVVAEGLAEAVRVSAESAAEPAVAEVVAQEAAAVSDRVVAEGLAEAVRVSAESAAEPAVAEVVAALQQEAVPLAAQRQLRVQRVVSLVDNLPEGR
jgi:hypothetical protein